MGDLRASSSPSGIDVAAGNGVPAGAWPATRSGLEAPGAHPLPPPLPLPQTSSSPPASQHAQEQLQSFSDDFLMHVYKVAMCSNTTRHSWKTCPYAHAAERARRRPLQQAWYSSELCPRTRRGIPCPDGDACRYAHHVFESHLHPDRYKTSLCSDGPRCARPLCFFAHDASELRAPPPSSMSLAAAAANGSPPAVAATASAPVVALPAYALVGGGLAAPLSLQVALSAPPLPAEQQVARFSSAPQLAPPHLSPPGAGSPAGRALSLPRTGSGAGPLVPGSLLTHSVAGAVPPLAYAQNGPPAAAHALLACAASGAASLTVGTAASNGGCGGDDDVTRQLLQLLKLQERQQAAIADTVSLLMAQQSLQASTGGCAAGAAGAVDWHATAAAGPAALPPLYAPDGGAADGLALSADGGAAALGALAPALGDLDGSWSN